MQIYEWELLKVSHRLGKSCEHEHYGSGDMVFLIRQVTALKHMFKGLCKFMGGSPSQRVTTFPCLVAIGLVQVEI